MRVNFNLNDDKYEDLRYLASMEKRSMTEIITSLIETYIQEHSQQLGILKSAMTEARSMTADSRSNHDG